MYLFPKFGFLRSLVNIDTVAKFVRKLKISGVCYYNNIYDVDSSLAQIKDKYIEQLM